MTAYPNAKYVDGYFKTEQETTVIPEPRFPFENSANADTYSRTYARQYQVEPKLFLPKTANRTSWANLLLQSENLASSSWTKGSSTATANVATAPDGQATMNKLLEVAATAEHNASQAATVAASALEVSAFTQSGLGRDWLKITFTDSAAAGFSAFFDVTAGRVGTVAGTGATARIVPLGNSQYRCVLNFTPAAGAGTFKANISTDGATISYAGDAAKGLYLWGLQVAQGTDSPYISTTLTTRTVSAPDRDRTDPMAYLKEEDAPIVQASQAMTVARLFARIPKTQSDPISLNVPKPTLSGSFPQVFGGFRLFQPDSTLAQYDAYAAQTVTADTGVPGFYPTGGTYATTWGADTASGVAYNADAATLQTALNALTYFSNRGNATVSGSYNSAGGFVITFNSYAQITIATGSLTGGTISKVESLLNGGYTQTVRAYIAQTIPSTAASITSLVSTGTKNASFATGGTIPANAIQFNSFAGNGSEPSATFTGGAFTITLAGVTSSAIAYNALLSDVQNVLDVMASGKYTALVRTPLSSFNPYNGLTYTWTDGGSILSSNNSGISFLIQVNDLPATGGTYTLTAFTQTTAAIAYNATAATVQTALNDAAMTNVLARGGCTVTGTLLAGFVITFLNAAPSASAASLTPAGCGAMIAQIDGGIGRIVRLTFSNPTSYRDLYAASHGILVGDTIYIHAAAGTYYPLITNFAVVDANTIRLYVVAADSFAAAVTIDEVGRRSKHNYVPGTKEIRANRITVYFLPGVSVGITVAGDYVLPTYQGDPTTFLLAVFAGGGLVNWQVGDVVQWDGKGPILSQSTVQLDAADV